MKSQSLFLAVALIASSSVSAQLTYAGTSDSAHPSSLLLSTAPDRSNGPNATAVSPSPVLPTGYVAVTVCPVTTSADLQVLRVRAFLSATAPTSLTGYLFSTNSVTGSPPPAGSPLATATAQVGTTPGWYEFDFQTAVAFPDRSSLPLNPCFSFVMQVNPSIQWNANGTTPRPVYYSSTLSSWAPRAGRLCIQVLSAPALRANGTGTGGTAVNLLLAREAQNAFSVLALGAFSSTPLPSGAPFGGGTLYVGFSALFLTVTPTGATGSAAAVLAIPPDPLLVGLPFAVQYLGVAQASPSAPVTFSTSNAVRIRIQ
jgi:hypothetical protein